MKIIKILKITLKVVPVIGRLVKNIDSPKGGRGRIHWSELIEDLIELGATAGLTYLLT